MWTCDFTWKGGSRWQGAGQAITPQAVGGSLFIAADDHWDETGRLQGMTVMQARFPGDLLLEKRDTQKNLLQYLNSSHVFSFKHSAASAACCKQFFVKATPNKFKNCQMV